MAEVLSLVELFAILAFPVVIAVGGIAAGISDRKRDREARENAAKPSINLTLQEARAKGFPY